MPRQTLRLILVVMTGLLAAIPANAQSLEDAVLAEINFARTQPREYARELRQYRRQFEGRIVADEHGERMTFEGVRPVDQAIAFLEAQQPLPPLRPGAILARAAADHAAEQGSRGSRGHISADGATPARRVAARGGGQYVSETIAYGESDPAAIVRSLIVDDGVPLRTHRAVLFMRDLRYAGVGCGSHAAYAFMCVMDYSQTIDGTAPIARSLARSEYTRTEDAAF
jgi:uncharacterized protein YkwD